MSHNSTSKLSKMRGQVPGCPRCQADNEVIPILYGLPNREMLELAKQGRARLGGCDLLTSGTYPQFYCKADQLKF